jgi:hypothetical protein
MADVGITLATAGAKLAEYLAAETAVLGSQSYEIGERKLTRADLAEIRQGIDYWQGWVTRLGGTTQRSVGRVRRGWYRSR